MNSRIRYARTNEANVLESTRVFTVGANSYRIRLNTGELSFVVFDPSTEIIAVSGTGATLPILKKRVKSALEELGVSFSAETRERAPRDLPAQTPVA